MTAKRSCASGWQYINARQSRSWIITRSARSCTGFPGWALSATYSAVSCLPSGRTRLRGKLSNFAATQSFNAEQAWSSAFTLQEVRSRLKPELRPTAYELIRDRSGVQPSRNPKFQLRTSMEFSVHQSFNSEQAWSSAFRLQEVRSRLKPELQTSGLGRKRFFVWSSALKAA